MYFFMYDVLCLECTCSSADLTEQARIQALYVRESVPLTDCLAGWEAYQR